jgi:phosphatidylserine/phosphatidylglycerophosphate/cardiolipin synthase-like enzyme
VDDRRGLPGGGVPAGDALDDRPRQLPDHRRILVVDGRVGVTGGSGTSGKWSGNGMQEGLWRDTDMRVEGPVVNQLQADGYFKVAVIAEDARAGES